MRIGFDARLAHVPGVGRYVRELLHALARVDGRNEYVVYYAPPAPGATVYVTHRSDLRETLHGDNFRLEHFPCPTYGWREQVALRALASRDGLDLFHSPFINAPLAPSCRLVMTLHDLIPLQARPVHASWRRRLYFALMLQRSLRSAERIIAVSEFVRRELLRRHPGTAAKVQVVRHGVSPRFAPAPDPQDAEVVRRICGLEGGYLLYVGTCKRHKNLEGLVADYGALARSDGAAAPLVVVAKDDPHAPEARRLARRLELDGKVRFVEHVPEEDLPALYRRALALVCPSLYEGFGFTVLEAMACGAAVVASNVTSLPEVAGEAALFFDPAQGGALARALARVLRDGELRRSLRARALQRAALFCWEEAARETVGVYASAMHS